MKGIFAGRSALLHTGILTVCVLVGFCMLSACSVVFAVILKIFTGIADTQSVIYLQGLQLIASVCIFFMPAMATAWLCDEHPLAFLAWKRTTDLRLFAWVAAATFFVSPTVSLTGYLNMQLQLPDCMAALEELMRNAEEKADELITLMLQQKGIVSLAVNLLVIAVAAGVCEEVFFRGTLLSIIRRKIRNPHVAIWVVALIFSTIHLQFYGFIPRLLLGALLGYLRYWTKNIWYPIFAHFLYNAVAVIGMSSISLKDNAFFVKELNVNDLGWFSSVALITLTVCIGCLYAIYRHAVKNRLLKNTNPGENT